MLSLSRILEAQTPLTLSSFTRGAQPLVLGDLAQNSKGRTVFIAPDEAAMRAISDTVNFFAPDVQVIEFPAWDCLPYDRSSPALSVSAKRLTALYQLQANIETPQLLITTANAVTQRLLKPFRVRECLKELKPGIILEHDSLSRLLVRQGYTRTDTVVDHGEYALRGSVIDIFPSSLDKGLRLDFFGDELESLRLFDPNTQMTIDKIERHLLLPASEAIIDDGSIKRFRSRYREAYGASSTQDPLYQAVTEGRRLAGMEHWLPFYENELATIFDYLTPKDQILVDSGAATAFEERFNDLEDYYQARAKISGNIDNITYRPIAKSLMYLNEQELNDQLLKFNAHRCIVFPEPETKKNIDLGFSSARDFTPERKQGLNIYKEVGLYLNKVLKNNKKVIIAAYSNGSRSRIISILAEAGFVLTPADTWLTALSLCSMKHAVAVVLPLDRGFANSDIECITEQDILGDRLVRRRKRRKNADAFLAELQSLSQGDLVVHEEHGIGKYNGLEPIPVGTSKHDCVMLEYKSGDKLFIPVENIDVLSRYGSPDGIVQLDRLGGEGWQRRRSKLKERIRAIAGELMEVAAERALKKAPILVPEVSSFDQFVEKFPWVETDDQDAAISDVIHDLSLGRPMDRLICGDVGFGKTEVALRAAFITAMSGYQVAIIAPTTLLARQHFVNFLERFEGFPLKIGRLSRLVPPKELSETREGLKNGTLDIVIGTHAILSGSTKFNNLGLVIVDEEQRFGVTHKEKLKALRTDIHVLTLTATPIPRTLQMAMSGLRELSTIQTPPVDRLSVRTYVMEWDDVVLREALLREHHRGGQSFVVVPRISDMEEVLDWLRNNIPEIKCVSAHGQMSSTDVEERMSAFYDKKYDVLLSTTIVESGLDIPSANTIIIHRADRFGLAQLYQLRGRVGRSKMRAYAYLCFGSQAQLTAIAEKRLKVLNDLDSLGAGFQLASHDLDIRGAGNLLGDEQSGHIREVGFELYQSMLEEAILAAKAGNSGLSKRTERISPQITVDAPIMIPEEYVPDLAVRMALYRRLNDAGGRSEVEALAAEMIDRFGPLPQETDNLIRLIEIKNQAIEANISKIEVGAKGTLVTFFEDDFPDPNGLLVYVEKLKDTAKLRPDMKLVINRSWPTSDSRLNGLFQLTKGLSRIAKKARSQIL